MGTVFGSFRFWKIKGTTRGPLLFAYWNHNGWSSQIVKPSSDHPIIRSSIEITCRTSWMMGSGKLLLFPGHPRTQDGHFAHGFFLVAHSNHALRGWNWYPKYGNIFGKFGNNYIMGSEYGNIYGICDMAVSTTCCTSCGDLGVRPIWPPFCTC